jgi:hypothetical protein
MRGINEQQRERAYKNAVKKAAVQNQRAERLGGGRGSFSGEEWLSLCNQHQNRCVLCGHPRPLTPDHVIPLMRGGQNTIENIQPLCHACNIVKRGTSMDYRSYSAQPEELADLATRSSPCDGVEAAPRPLWRAQLSSMEQYLDKQGVLPVTREKGHVHPEHGRWPGSELVPVLVAEIKRLRHLVLANESLAHIETVAWWYRGTLPNTLRDYLHIPEDAS